MTHEEWLRENHDKVRAYAKAHYQRNRSAILARHQKRYSRWTEQRRDDQYKCLYGITVADYEKLLAAQDGKCALCGKPPKRHRLAVDHNHETGKVRGLLCTPCNGTVVGRVEAIPGFLERLITYVR